MNSYQAIINSPVGKLGISLTKDTLSGIRFLDNSTQLLKPETPLAHQVVNELESYFHSAQHRFKLALTLTVSTYQQSVLKALQTIPAGHTLSYGELARQLESGPRAIGMACRLNPIVIIIPCHRIVAANHLGGYSGATDGPKMKIKEWLLEHETRTGL